MAQSEMLRPADVAFHLGVTTGRVYQLIGAGVIPCVRSGRSILIPRAAWETWMANLTIDALTAITATSNDSDEQSAGS